MSKSLVILIAMLGFAGCGKPSQFAAKKAPVKSDSNASPQQTIPEISNKTEEPIIEPSKKPEEPPPPVVKKPEEPVVITCNGASEGATRVRYQVAQSVFPAEVPCESRKETQTCQSGTWSGTYTFEKCKQMGSRIDGVSVLSALADQAPSNGAFVDSRVSSPSQNFVNIRAWSANTGSQYRSPWMAGYTVTNSSTELNSGGVYTNSSYLSSTYARVLLWYAFSLNSSLAMNADTTEFTLTYNCPFHPASNNRLDFPAKLKTGGSASLNAMAADVVLYASTIYRNSGRSVWENRVKAYMDNISQADVECF